MSDPVGFAKDLPGIAEFSPDSDLLVTQPLLFAPSYNAGIDDKIQNGFRARSVCNLRDSASFLFCRAAVRREKLGQELSRHQPGVTRRSAAEDGRRNASPIQRSRSRVPLRHRVRTVATEGRAGT